MFKTLSILNFFGMHFIWSITIKEEKIFERLTGFPVLNIVKYVALFDQTIFSTLFPSEELLILASNF